MKSKACSRLKFLAASGGELIRTGGAGVGQMLGLAYIDFDIICFGVLSDYHSGVYLLSGPINRVPRSWALYSP